MSAALDLPEPLRSRVLLELAEDLASLAAEYRSRGVSEDDAVGLAQERLLLSPEAVGALVRLYTNGLERFFTRLASHLRTGFDAFLFAAATLPLLLASALAVAGEMRHTLDDPLLWSLLLSGLTILVKVAGSAVAIHRRSHPFTAIRRAAFSLLPLAAAVVSLGLLGFFWKMYAIARLFGTGSSADPATLVAHIVAGASLLAFGLLLATAAGFAYLLLASRIARIERLECAVLLAP